MSKRSIRAYVVSTVQAAYWPVGQVVTTLATTTPPAWPHVFGTTPKGAPIDYQVIVQGITSHEHRESVPRATAAYPNGGRKWIDHEVHLLVHTGDPDESAAIERLDDLDQAVRQALRVAVLPAAITDSHSGEVSTVFYIGEEMRVTNDGTEQQPGDPEEGTIEEGDVRAFEIMVVSVREMLQA